MNVEFWTLLVTTGGGLLTSVIALVKSIVNNKVKYEALMQIQKRHIIEECRRVLKEGIISDDDYIELEEEYLTYKKLGGNGTAKALYKEVREIWMESTQETTTTD